MTLACTELDNGLRIITDTVETVESVALGVWCDVGTRHENLAHNGVAHMVEHMMFDGTKRRSALNISSEIESVGGQMNAFTSREITAYYVHLLKDHAPLAMDVLSDMIQHSTFPDSEIEKERGVITQEIGMSNDTPDDLVFDIAQAISYPNQSLGAPILGTAEIVQSMQKETLQNYVRRFYTPDRLVISAAGNISHDAMVSLTQRYFNALPHRGSENHKTDYAPARYQGGEKFEEKDLEQSHIVMGYRTLSKSDPRYHAAVLLSSILGGGMSSRLFQEVREKRGLAYSIYASHSAYQDDGHMEIYAGTAHDKKDELQSVVHAEIDRLCDKGVTSEELNRAKNQMKTGLLMSLESMMSRTNRQAKYLINFKKALHIPDLLQEIDAVRESDILSLARAIFQSKAQPTSVILGQ